MKDKEPTHTTQSQSILHLTPPVSGSIVHGVTATVNLDGIANVFEVEVEKGIKDRIRAANAERKKAIVAKAAAVTERERLASTVRYPVELLTNLQSVATAITKFHPDAVVQSMADVYPVHDYILKTSTSRAAVVNSRGHRLFEGSMTVAMIPALVAAHQETIDIDHEIQVIDNKLQLLGQDLEGVKDLAKVANAGVVRLGLERDKDGQAALNVVDAAAARILADLDKRLGGSFEAN